MDSYEILKERKRKVVEMAKAHANAEVEENFKKHDLTKFTSDQLASWIQNSLKVAFLRGFEYKAANCEKIEKRNVSTMTFVVRGIAVASLTEKGLVFHIEEQGVEPYTKDLGYIHWDSSLIRSFAAFLNKVADKMEEESEWDFS